MALHGTAFIAIWHDLAPGFESEFERWHTEEHMPERLGVPGFLRGTRYMNWDQAPRVCFTLYELSHIEVFRSPGYLARLNAPTDWTHRVQPGMTNFLRGSCETLVSLGQGIGGAVASARITVDEAGSGDITAKLAAVAFKVNALPGVTSTHLGRHAARFAGLATAESGLRPPAPESRFDYVLMFEGIDLETLERASTGVRHGLLDAGAREAEIGCYRLSYQLRAPV
ncbi:MAG: hypothetical protein R3E83_00375 [Burkholderiaceae bacterium]